MSDITKNLIVPILGYTKEQLISSGIYCIKNTINNKLYVGSAAKSFRRRWNEHRSMLNLNHHHSKHLQRSWNKYGKDNFQFIIIEYCKSENCITREQFYLDSLRVSESHFGYNCSPTARNTLGIKRSEETKAKIRASKTGKKQSAETIAKKVKGCLKTYVVTSPEGIETVINNLKEFCAENSLGACNMINVSAGRVSHHKQWLCRKHTITN